MKFFGIVVGALCVIVTIGALTSTNPRAGATAAGELPENWRQLPASELASALETFFTEEPNPSREQLEEIAAQVWTFLGDSEFVGTANSRVLLSLVDLMTLRLGPWYTDERRAALAASLSARLSSDAAALDGASFDEVSAGSWAPALRAGVDRAVVADAAARFCSSTDWRALSPLRIAKLARFLEDDAVSASEFSLRWEATLTAEVSDGYVFSLERRGGAAKVWLGGALILDSTDQLDPETEGDTDISTESAPVSLSAGVGQALRVEYVFDADEATAESAEPDWVKALEHGWCHLFLRWKGSTGEPEVVAGSVLSPPGARAGESGAELSCFSGRSFAGTASARRAREISLLRSGGAPASVHRALQEELYTESLLQLQGREFLSGADISDLFWAPRELAEYTTIAEKRALLATLAANPHAMGGIPAGEVYHLLRVHQYMLGAETDEVVVSWCGLEPQVETEFGVYPSWELEVPSYMHSNYGGYWHLAPLFEDDARLNALVAAVTEPDGSCNLRAAYICTFAHREKGDTGTWIAFLDDRLRSPELAGDVRASWLVARSYAEEVTLPAEPVPTAGRSWLEEALQVAETEEMKLRLAGEVVSRFAAVNRLDLASELLERMQATLTSDTAQAELAGLLQSATDTVAQVAVLDDRLRRELAQKILHDEVEHLKSVKEEMVARDDAENNLAAIEVAIQSKQEELNALIGD